MRAGTRTLYCRSIRISRFYLCDIVQEYDLCSNNKNRHRTNYARIRTQHAIWNNFSTTFPESFGRKVLIIPLIHLFPPVRPPTSGMHWCIVFRKINNDAISPFWTAWLAPLIVFVCSSSALCRGIVFPFPRLGGICCLEMVEEIFINNNKIDINQKAPEQI